MARVKGGVTTKARHKKVLKKTAGHRGARSRQFKRANTSLMKALQYGYIGRRLKKRDMRALWIQRINAAARLNGTKYSELQNWLGKSGIGLDRRVLADLAVHCPEDFGQIVETAKRLATNAVA